MYNKLFAKILDSSIWLEPAPTRIVWITFIAAMDETGFVQLASVPNVALRARVSVKAAEVAIQCLESPDPLSSDPDHEGRRIEKVPGGWMVLNAEKYRDLVTRHESKARNRARVQKHREAKRNAAVTPCNAPVMESEADTDTEADTKKRPRDERAPSPSLPPRSVPPAERVHRGHTFPDTCEIGKCLMPSQADGFEKQLIANNGGIFPDGANIRQFAAEVVAEWKANGVPAEDTFKAWQAAFERRMGVRRGGASAVKPQPSYSNIGAWRDECVRLHGTTDEGGPACGNQSFHLAKLASQAVPA